MKRPADFILDSFDGFNFKVVVYVPIIAVYNNPKDYPGKYVARLWGPENKPTNFIVIKDSLEDIRRSIPAWMKRLDPYPSDDPVLVETWL